MLKIKDIAIRKKLIAIQLLTVFIILLLYSVFNVINNLNVFQNFVIEELTSTAQIIGANSEAAISFMDNDAAEEILSSLSPEEHIVNAWIYDSEGNLFAKYSKEGYSDFSFPKLEGESFEFNSGYIVLSQNIKQAEEVIGVIALRKHMVTYQNLVRRSVIIALFVLVIGMVVALLLSIFTQRTISNPIKHLVTLTKKVSKTKDYSLSVKKESNDEIGMLCESFNEMLEQVRKHEQSLKEYQNVLEQKVKERTEELSSANKELEKSLSMLTEEITQRESAQAELAKNAAVLEAALQNMDQGMLMADKNWNLVAYNKRIIDMLDIDGSTFPKLTFEEFQHHWETKTGTSKEIFKPLTGHQQTDNKILFEVPFGDRIVEVCHSLLAEGGFIRTFTDITHHKQLERDLIKAKIEAEEANKAKSEFLANMSHEIRTPMNAVLGFTDLLQSMITDPKQESYLKSIKTSGNSLLTLINDILDLSKIEAGKMELEYNAVNPFNLFKGIEQFFSMKIEQKGLEFSIDIAEDIPESLILDGVRLRQVLFNLIGNAVKFTEKGYIKLSTHKIYTEVDKSNLDLIISIEDTGIGMSDEFQKKVFDAFTQQEGQSGRRYGGTGLGLGISKRLVEMMGGKINLKSKVKKGSTFEITLHDVAVSATKPDSELYPVFEWEKILFDEALILIVDDVDLNRSLISEFLKESPFKIFEAKDGEEALQIAKEKIPNLILMDIKMPKMNGYEAAGLIKNDNQLNHIPIIALTGSVMKQDEEKIQETGFDGFLMKPIQKSILYEKLSKFLKHSEREKSEIKESKPESEDEIFKISPETLKIIPEIMNRLENEFMQTWESVNKKQHIPDIENFANEIKIIGEENSITLLSEYGQTLISHVNSFDIESMGTALNSYPELIEKIKTLEEEQNPK